MASLPRRPKTRVDQPLYLSSRNTNEPAELNYGDFAFENPAANTGWRDTQGVGKLRY